jgi:putative Holliday junction resolvase
MREPRAVQPSAGGALAALALTMDEGVVLGFDFGTRRIGVAIANGITREARPLAVIDAVGDARWARIAALVTEWQPVRFVVGIPRHPGGTPHEMTAHCEKFARRLHGRYGRPVTTVDERYSSAVVDGGRDDEAAAVILQQWLHENAAAAGVSLVAAGPRTAAATAEDGQARPGADGARGD